MCHQVLPEVDIALAAEAMALPARAGLNTQEVFDAVQASDGASWIFGNRVPHMLEGDKTVYSAIPNSQKDSVRSLKLTNALDLNMGREVSS
jgi:3-hydroxyisobutyrate dehydrogenase-like beta-hydroxyacid dehydrogenase